MRQKNIKVGLLGAGYIADWHAEAISRCKDATLVGVADLARSRANSLAAKWAVPAFGSLSEMHESTGCDAVHILVPPDRHAGLVVDALNAGLHVFVEKPMAVSQMECDTIRNAAERSGKTLGVNHNFLFLPSAESLGHALSEGIIGPLRQLEVIWAMPLPQINFGPHGVWPFNGPAQPFMEVGGHPLAFVRWLLPRTHFKLAHPSSKVQLPFGRYCYRRWHLVGESEETAVQVTVDVGPTYPSLEVRAVGLGGEAIVDYRRDVFTVSRQVAAGIVFEPLTAGRSVVKQLNKQLRRNFKTQLKSLDKLSPFGLSLTTSIGAFYSRLQVGDPVDRRHCLNLATSVTEDLCRTAQVNDLNENFEAVQPRSRVAATTAKVLITGGTGFIGRCLVSKLLEKDVPVRVITRGSGGCLQELESSGLEIVQGRLSSQEDVRRAMQGIDQVVHLSKGHGRTWDEYLETDVRPTETLATVAAEMGIRQFLYTGTIDSYDSESLGAPITDSTPVDPKITGRNLYARSKARGEDILIELSRERGLPLTVAKPGIVIGKNGPPCHWGVAMWYSPTTCRLWGNGEHPLPFVLVEDVADALVAMLENPNAIGCNFLLTGPPLLSGRQYVEAYASALGSQLDVLSRRSISWFFEDLGKYALKKIFRRTAHRPTLHDWRCRSHRRPYQPEKARQMLNWRCCNNKEELIRLGIQLPVEQFLR